MWVDLSLSSKAFIWFSVWFMILQKFKNHSQLASNKWLCGICLISSFDVTEVQSHMLLQFSVERMFFRSKKTYACSTLVSPGRLGLTLESSFSSGSSEAEGMAIGLRRPQNHIMWESDEGAEAILLKKEKSSGVGMPQLLFKWLMVPDIEKGLIYAAPEYGPKISGLKLWRELSKKGF